MAATLDIKTEPGFYWIKINNELTIAEYTGRWFFIGSDEGTDCLNFTIIEKITPPII